MTEAAAPSATAPDALADARVPIPVAAAAEEVVVLDFGGQYSQLIARRVRELGVFSELLPHHVGPAAVAARAPKALILSGGPASVYAPDAPQLDPGFLDLGIPVLGICYGMQLARPRPGRPRRGRRGRRVRALTPDGHRTGSAARRLPAPTRAAGCRTGTPSTPRRPASPRSRRRPPPRWPRWRTPSGRSTGSSSTPRWCTHPTASRSSSGSSPRSPAASGPGAPRRSSTTRSPGSGPRSATGA